MSTKLLRHESTYILEYESGDVSIISIHEARDFLLNFADEEYDSTPKQVLSGSLMTNLQAEIVAEADASGTLIVRSPAVFKEIIIKTETEFYTVSEFAQKYGWSEPLVRRKCKDNEIAGVVQKGYTYLIPSYATMPEKVRRRSRKSK